MYLAQLNIAQLKYDLDDPRVAGFVDNLDRVNGVAERHEGFVWRLKDDNEGMSAFDDPRIIVNLSVWKNAESLEKFVWQTVHKQIYARRAEWFDVMDTMSFAMWWVDEDDMPTEVMARERLEYLEANGPSDFAFGWEHLPQAELWKTARCA